MQHFGMRAEKAEDAASLFRLEALWSSYISPSWAFVHLAKMNQISLRYRHCWITHIKLNPVRPKIAGHSEAKNVRMTRDFNFLKYNFTDTDDKEGVILEELI